jgi:hypothetical protein
MMGVAELVAVREQRLLRRGERLLCAPLLAGE